MTQPGDDAGVRRFCGMVQYMARFLPGLSMTLEPLRKLNRKNTEFVWSPDCEQSFQEVKQKLTFAPILKYYDPNKEWYCAHARWQTYWVCLKSTDDFKTEVGIGWKRGPGSTIWCPEIRPIYLWTSCEKNDHKPLETILRKNPSNAPKRLKDIMMKLNRYITFKFLKGEELVIADTLSRAYMKEIDSPENRFNVFSVKINEELNDSRLKEIKDATDQDPDLQELIDTIQSGWPDHKSTVMDSCKPYFDFRDKCVSRNCRQGWNHCYTQGWAINYQTHLHNSHNGSDSMRRRAKGTFYWPWMVTYLKQLVSTCEACQELKPRTTKPLL